MLPNAETGWESLLRTDAPARSSLKGALFTTYDRADSRLLVEHFLPFLLKLKHLPADEGGQRQNFLIELHERLKNLSGRLAVVSSVLREELSENPEDSTVGYDWVWQSIRRLTVGCDGSAIQHAKLWMFHWGAAENDRPEYLEIVVSSTNLTFAAFKGQLQASWRACIPLQPQGSQRRQASWGILPEFLKALGASSGCMPTLDPFIALLARGECPVGVTFVASKPGIHSQRSLSKTKWGAAGLQHAAPSGRGKVGISILSPFIGSWDPLSLKRWCAHFYSTPDRIALVWIDNSHPWAKAKRWVLPSKSLAMLAEAGARLQHLRHVLDDASNTDRFHKEHRSVDARWSHAKMYCLQRGRASCLLVTSANFSMAAWGKESANGDLSIENFELGVSVKQAAWPFRMLGRFEKMDDAATVEAGIARTNTLIGWADAKWDGTHITVNCRYDDRHTLAAEARCGTNWATGIKWTVRSEGTMTTLQAAWRNALRPPTLIRLTCAQEFMSLPIFDGRPICERVANHPPEVDAACAEAVRDGLLFEEYGGRVAAEPSGTDSGIAGVIKTEKIKKTDGTINDNYGVPEFEEARRHLAIVDNWVSRISSLQKGTVQNFERHCLQRDAAILEAAFQRLAKRDALLSAEKAIGARLAAEEMKIWRKWFQEI